MFNYTEYKAPKLLFNDHYMDMEIVAFIEPVYKDESNKELSGAAFHFKVDPTKYILIECTTEEYKELLGLLFPSAGKH